MSLTGEVTWGVITKLKSLFCSIIFIAWSHASSESELECEIFFGLLIVWSTKLFERFIVFVDEIPLQISYNSS